MVIVKKSTIFLYLFIPLSIVELFRKKIMNIDIIRDLEKNTFLTENVIIFIFIIAAWIMSMILLYIRAFKKLGGV